MKQAAMEKTLIICVDPFEKWCAQAETWALVSD